VRVVCLDLDADDLFKIMKFSEGSLLRQYERAFALTGSTSVSMRSTPLDRRGRGTERTGARGLLTVFEKLFAITNITWPARV